MADSQSKDPASAESSRTGARAVLGNRRVAAVGALFVVALAIWLFRSPAPDRPSREEVSGMVSKAVGAAVSDAKRDVASAPASSALAFRRVLPSVVFITTDETAKPETADASSDSAALPKADPGPNAERTGGLGAGVIINADGVILTANHVVSGAKVITVTFADGTSSGASVVSAEPERDIAVLRPDRKPEVVVPAVMGGGVNVGDEAYVIGHPLGLGDSMSAGVISGLGRSVPSEDGTVLKGLIQFDAAVNPGNSGGPLLNRNGQVVGIVTALANPSKQGFFVGIGFAVPIDEAGGSAGGPPQ